MPQTRTPPRKPHDSCTFSSLWSQHYGQTPYRRLAGRRIEIREHAVIPQRSRLCAARDELPIPALHIWAKMIDIGVQVWDLADGSAEPPAKNRLRPDGWTAQRIFPACRRCRLPRQPRESAGLKADWSRFTADFQAKCDPVVLWGHFTACQNEESLVRSSQ
jgi:hypothetical protein